MRLFEVDDTSPITDEILFLTNGFGLCARLDFVKSRADGVGRARWQKVLRVNCVSTLARSARGRPCRVTRDLQVRSAIIGLRVDLAEWFAARTAAHRSLQLLSLKLSDFTLQQRLAQSSCRQLPSFSPDSFYVRAQINHNTYEWRKKPNGFQ